MEAIEKGLKKNIPSGDINVPCKELNSSGIYEVTCSKGHLSKVSIVNLHFEMLFEYGLNALADGYYREAVASFASALERYVEFFLKSTLRASGCDFDFIDKQWKIIGKQSERQIGAYTMLYASLFKEEAPILNPNKEVQFRNNVIHNGYIPTPEESIKFGESVLAAIEVSLVKLKSMHPEAVEEAFNKYCYANSLPKEEVNGSVNMLTYIDVMNSRDTKSGDIRQSSIRDYLKSILDHREPRRLRLYKELPKKYRK